MEKLAPPTTIRLPVEMHAELTARAASAGVTLTELVRERLRHAVQLEEAIECIRSDLAVLQHEVRQQRSLAKPEPNGQPHAVLNPGAVLEILLLLRDIGGPMRQRAAAAEVERQGCTVWRSAI